MTSVSEAFRHYCDVVESMGATIARRMAPAASESDIERLESRLGAELPAEVRAWYDITNGLDYNHPETTSWPSANLFPGLWARSVDEAINWIDHWEGINDSPDRFQRTPTLPVPLLSNHNGWDSVLLADCESSRVVTFDLEGYDGNAGFYHESLVDFIDGCRRCAEAGYYAVVDGGVCLDEDQWFVLCRTTSFTDAVLCGFGFDPTAPLPPLFGTQRPPG